VVHLPRGVEAAGDVTASERLLFYLFFVIWTSLTSKVLRKGDSGIKWRRVRFLKLKHTRSVGKRV
jgi:hypothetical protein